MGYMEERNPLYSIWLPEWFLNQHTIIRNNLEINQHRLTSNFDIHQTLLDVLNENFEKNASFSNIKRGMSQLYELPEARTCPEAGIPDGYCLCGAHKTINHKQKFINNAANVIVKHLNDLLKPSGKN